jgi:hypothetical protein
MVLGGGGLAALYCYSCDGEAAARGRKGWWFMNGKVAAATFLSSSHRPRRVVIVLADQVDPDWSHWTIPRCRENVSDRYTCSSATTVCDDSFSMRGTAPSAFGQRRQATLLGFFREFSASRRTIEAQQHKVGILSSISVATFAVGFSSTEPNKLRRLRRQFDGTGF